MTKAKEPKPPKDAVLIDTPRKLDAVKASGKLPWRCDICGAENLTTDACPTDGKARP